MRADVLVIGHVQHGGYRALIQELALKLQLCGFVENNKDGTVQINVEGPRDAIDLFLREINVKNSMINVKEIRTDFKDATGDYHWFGVSFENFGFKMANEYAEMHVAIDENWEHHRHAKVKIGTNSKTSIISNFNAQFSE